MAPQTKQPFVEPLLTEGASLADVTLTSPIAEPV
jgi:hypothetical protein